MRSETLATPGVLGATVLRILPPLDPPADLAPASSHGLPLEWFRDLTPQLDGLWLIKKLLPATGLALIYGHPGSGKSFLALDFAFHVALGWPWNGRKVRAGLVIYVGAEGTAGLRNRIVAFRRYHDLEAGHDVPLALIPTPIDLQAIDADTPRLIAAIREAAAHSGQPPALIVIDTLSKTFGGGKENSDDMAGYVSNCQRIASAFGCCVVPVHHRPKDAESEEPRGHGSLKGGVDTVLLVEAGKPKRVRVTKQKDADPGDPIGFNLVSVDLGFDEDGDAVTSCIVEITEGVPTPARNGRRLSDKQSNVLTALNRSVEESGVDAPPGIPFEMMKLGLVSKVVPVAAWRAAVFATNIDPDAKPDTLLKAFNRAVEALQDAKIVQVWEGLAWPTPL